MFPGAADEHGVVLAERAEPLRAVDDRLEARAAEAVTVSAGAVMGGPP